MLSMSERCARQSAKTPSIQFWPARNKIASKHPATQIGGYRVLRDSRAVTVCNEARLAKKVPGGSVQATSVWLSLARRAPMSSATCRLEAASAVHLWLVTRFLSAELSRVQHD